MISCKTLKICNAVFAVWSHFGGGTKHTVGGWIAETHLGHAHVIPMMLGHANALPGKGERGVNEHVCMSTVLFVMISHIMCDEATNVDDVDNLIKLFLSCLDKFEIAFSEFETRKWLQRGNFTSLLNIKEQIDQFGSLRLHWEGNCERCVQSVKPMLKSIRHTTAFLKTPLNKLHKEQSLQLVMQQIEKEDDEPVCQHCNDMRLFGNIMEVTEMIEN